MLNNKYYQKNILKYLDYFSHSDYKILELGSIDGMLINKMSGKRKMGVCFDEQEYELCLKNAPDVPFILLPQDDLELNEKFDLIIISNYIGRLKDIQKTFESLHKACHEQTKIIVCYYNYYLDPFIRLAEFLKIKKKTAISNALTGSDIRNLLELSDFSVYRQTKRILIPVYIPMISWFFNTVLANFPLIHFFQLNNYTFAKFNRTESKEYGVSVIIPARNESGNIENAILRLPKMGKLTEIIFVEGNSTDDTWDKIQEIQKKYSSTHDIKIARQKGKGKADAVRVGFDMAQGDILMILDADLTVPPEDLPKFYDAIASGKGDFINGSRLVYPMEKEAMRFLNLLGNRFFSWTFTWLLERPFKDTLCGTKVIFKKDYFRLVTNRKFFGDFDPFGDFDLIFGAHKLNLKIVEIPIRYKERTYGSTNISRFKHGLILLKMSAFAARKIKFI